MTTFAQSESPDPQKSRDRQNLERRACAYHVVRYLPNLVRDEWVNIGILLFDPAKGRILRRMMEEPGGIRPGPAPAPRRR